MAFRMLMILVEGSDDVMFFRASIVPLLAQAYDHVQLKQYGEDTRSKVNRFLNDIDAMNKSEGIQAEYIFVTDLNASPCVTQRKEKTATTFRRVTADRILVVRREIESWYLAGLDESECERLGVPTDLDSTDHLTKEQFLSLMPNRFGSKAAFMQAILQVYDHAAARSRNRSFDYFAQKFMSNEEGE